MVVPASSMRRRHTAKGVRTNQPWCHMHKTSIAQLRHRVVVFRFFEAGSETHTSSTEAETHVSNDFNGLTSSKSLGHLEAPLLCQPLERAGGGLEAGDRGNILQPGDFPISQRALHVPEENDVGVAVDKGTQSQASDERREGVAHLSTRAVLRRIVFPDRRHVAAGVDAVINADRGDDECVRTEQMGVIPQNLSQQS